MTFTMKSNSVCWAVVKYLDVERSKHDGSFDNSEWGSEAAEAFCDEIQDFPIISGSEKPLTLGDLIEWTDKDKISKVMLEEKVFETWHHGRTVLLGDGTHAILLQTNCWKAMIYVVMFLTLTHAYVTFAVIISPLQLACHKVHYP